MRLKKQAVSLFGGRKMDRNFYLTADGLGRTGKRLQRGTMNVNLPLYKKQLPGLEEAGVNQATPWPESGADRAAPSREKQVPFFAQGKGFRENQKSFLLFVKDSQENSGYADKMLDAFRRFRIQLQGNIYICMLVF